MVFERLFKRKGQKKPGSSHPSTVTLPERQAELQAEAPAEEGQGEAPAVRSSVPRGVVLTDARVVKVIDNCEAPLRGIHKDSLRGILDLGTAFEYLPLHEGRFRLLSIAVPGDYPICSVEDYALDDAPPYAAMSYAWGLPIKRRAMFCKNPQSDMASFSISEHVLEALNSLYGYVPQGLKIWIDAICIDQDNPAEKAHQIAAMPRIYSKAEQVLCWLGPEADNSDLVIDDLPALGYWMRDALGTVISNRGDGLNDSPLEVPNNQRWVETALFFRRPWFHRLWVLQEMLLARELVLVCGRKTTSWDTLFMAAELLCSTSIDVNGVSQTGFKCVMNGIVELGALRLKAKGALTNGLSQPELIRIMLWSCMRQVTEPVDRIWALMGLAQPALRNSVSSLVDYSRPGRSNFFATYKAFTITIILQDEHLWMLSLVALTLRDQSLPSWCPNFCYDPHDSETSLL